MAATIWEIGLDFGAEIEGSTCFGHSTGVTQDNALTFAANFTGTATISGSGDNEIISIWPGEYSESEIVNIGVGEVTISLNQYQSGVGEAVTVKYKDGDSEANCEADTWNIYSAPFTSEGFVKVRVERA